MARWLIAGCGPSLYDPGREFRVVTLNRAVCFFQREVECAVVYHSLTLEAVFNDLHKAKQILSPHPFDIYSDFVQGRHYEKLENHPNYEAARDRWIIANRTSARPRNRDYTRFSSCLPAGGSSVGALWWLIKFHDVKEIWTVGLDGGVRTSNEVADAYSNRDHHPAGNYNAGLAEFYNAAAVYNVTWNRLGPDGETQRFQRNDNVAA